MRSAAFSENTDGIPRQSAPVPGKECLQQGSGAGGGKGNPVDECPEPFSPDRGPSFQEGGRVRTGESIGENAEYPQQHEDGEQQAGMLRSEDDDYERSEGEKKAAGEEDRVRREAQEKGPGSDSCREMDCQRPYALPLRHFLPIALRK